MIDRDLQKHAREFKGYLDNNQYDISDEGIFFPKANALAIGEYSVRSPGYADEVVTNLIPHQGMNYILMTALKQGPAQPNFYTALYSGNYTPTNALTAANFAATATEIASSTEGYSEPTRQLWTPADAAAGVMDSYANESVFTIATASSLTIRGMALLSSNVKGGVSGVLISAALLPNARIQYNGDLFKTGYRVRLQPPQ